MSNSKIFFYFCLSFIIGIAILSFLIIKFWIILLVLAALIILLISKRTRLTGVFLFAILIGILRCGAAFKFGKGDIVYLAGDKSRIVKGIVIEEPDERLNYTNIVLKPDYYGGRILIRTEKYPEYKYGDRIAAEGKIEIPREDDEFSWRGYLLRYGIQAAMFNPEISIQTGESGGGKIYSSILSLKQYLRDRINKAVSGAEADFLSALLLGYKRNLSQFWKDVFSKTGTSHIISISGMHISIISGMLLVFLLGIGFSRRLAFWILSAGILAYAALVGFSASVIRAGIMGFLVLLALRVGRVSSAKNAIAFAAAAMLLANPLLLKYDAGFQLSFMSVIGIFYLWPIIENWTKNFPNPKKIKSVFTLSLAAQIITLPIVVYNFKSVSLIAPIANFFIVPAIPVIMLLASVPLALSFFPAGILRILFLPYKEFSDFVLWILEIFSKVPVWEVSINWEWATISYVILFVFIYFYQHQEIKKLRN